MMNSNMMPAALNNDAELVSASLAGNRDAFGQIVARYQSLVCSLAYSATGNLTASEDLAQETFVAAWRQLATLREPEKLRAWLCGIARNLIHNALRKQGREPSHRAESLTEVAETHAPEPWPADKAISNEEAAMLWRALERIPELYREPMVLFYREQQSIEMVAQKLELTEDAVKQRLSRGRKLLHKEMLAFVEGALARTNPGQVFTLAVLLALPAMTTTTKAATLGVAAKSGAAAKGAGWLGLAGFYLPPALMLIGMWRTYRRELNEAGSEDEREFCNRYYRRLGVCTAVALLLIGSLMYWGNPLMRNRFGWFAGLILVFWVAYLLVLAGFLYWRQRARNTYLAAKMSPSEAIRLSRPGWEYRSQFQLLGLPAVHIRLGGWQVMRR
jgi:RNA polymerase sigma factor (sigma-70 family)